MKIYAMILLAGLGCSACRLQKEVYSYKTDSVRIVKVVERDTAIIVKADSSWLQALLECDSTGQVLLKEVLGYRIGRHLPPPSVKITGNILTAKACVDSFGVFLTLKDRYESTFFSNSVYLEKVKEVNRIRWWQKGLMYLGIFCMLYFIICLKNR